MNRRPAFRLGLVALISLVLLIGTMRHRSAQRVIIVMPVGKGAETASSQLILTIALQTYQRLSRFPHLVKHEALFAMSRADITWILVEDGDATDRAVAQLLAQSRLSTRYFASPSLSKAGHRGIIQRNLALQHIQEARLNGVIYFLDDDNLARSTLLDELQHLPRDAFTIFPVGNTGYFGFEGPLLSADATQIEYWSCDYCSRRWNVDMAGFALHSSLLQHGMRFRDSSQKGHLETDFLDALEEAPAAKLVLSRKLNSVVQVWHDFAETFKGAAAFDASWHTEYVSRHRPKGSWDPARGYSKANETLPRIHDAVGSLAES